MPYRLACTRGATAVEFALVLPLLLALMLGIIGFGRAMWIRQTLQFAVENAARLALADATLGSVSLADRVSSEVQAMAKVTPVVSVTATSSQIAIAATYAFTFPAPGTLHLGGVTLSAQSNMPR